MYILWQAVGFGSQLHHVIYCLTIAYGTGRTLVLNSSNWNYNADWEQVFQPLSNTCRDAVGRSRASWPGKVGQGRGEK